MDSVEPLTTAKEYVLSNGTRIVSDTAVSFYTPGEIFKIEVAGAIAVIAILLVTWALYKWYSAKYEFWRRQKEMEERIASGENVDPDDYPMPEGFNRGVLFAVGILIMIAGAVIYILPA